MNQPTTNAPVVAPKQLKKNDFLNAILTTPMTKANVVEALEGYSFVPTYIDYLTDHFVAQKKIIRNPDGTIQRKASKTKNTERKAYQVIDHGDHVELAEKTIGVAEKPEDWSLTPKRAVQVYNSKLFAVYNEGIKKAKALLPAEEKQAA